LCSVRELVPQQCGKFTQPETGKYLIQSHFKLLTEEELVYFQNF